MRQRFDVKSTASHDQGRLVAGMNFIDNARGGAPKLLRVHLFVKRDCVDQMMQHFCNRCGIGLRRQKIESAVDLESVGVDNLCADFLRDISRQLGFTSRGGSDDEECAGHRIRLTRPIRRMFRKQIGRRAHLRSVSRLKPSLPVNFASDARWTSRH